MIGSWRWNVLFGGFGAMLTFLISLSNNPIGTTFLRSIYALLTFAMIAFVVRLALGVLMSPAMIPAAGPGASSNIAEGSEDERGAVLDMMTPDEDDTLSELMKEQWTDGKGQPLKGFEPLQPKRLVSLDNPDPEQVVQAIRRLTDE
ncbi:hypothetical protein SD71_14860 [Cohnella kolymensis]|uniref:Uncharacterized protein n=1 Tax=Cohnella kolymensis TaxID=1590652 RepID=A0ABR5A2M3_9BACL|nr:hypothetical protein [Cohnella kolymensis]KIL35309.1 hypothetical protein SD71_14860 [Cohnella kolymensis]